MKYKSIFIISSFTALTLSGCVDDALLKEDLSTSKKENNIEAFSQGS